jgi:hypothetical protein
MDTIVDHRISGYDCMTKYLQTMKVEAWFKEEDLWQTVFLIGNPTLVLIKRKNMDTLRIPTCCY